MPDDMAKSKTSPAHAPIQGDTAAHRLRAWAKDEARKFIILFFYLWVLLSVFVLNQSIILRQQGIGFTAQGFALLNALVLA
jgi:hypothetical protein